MTERSFHLMDGAMGTELVGRGWPADKNPLWANVEAPDLVRAVHADYLQAGAECLVTNTFAGSWMQAQAEQASKARWQEALRCGVRLAREVAAGHTLVLASLGPPPALCQRQALSATLIQETLADYHERLFLLADADAYFFETQPSLEVAHRAASSCPFDKPIWFSFALISSPAGAITFAEGKTPAEIAERLDQITQVRVLGINCGRLPDLDSMVRALVAMRAASSLPLLARPNASTVLGAQPAGPSDNEQAQKPARPNALIARFVQAAGRLSAIGVSWIGGCCGIGPDAIAAVHSAHKP